MNLGGDGRETYPFVGASGSAFDNTHYDVSKLRQWNTVLEHMQHKSIAAHMVLGEQELPKHPTGSTTVNWVSNASSTIANWLHALPGSMPEVEPERRKPLW